MRALLSDSGIDTVRFRWRTDNEAYHKFQRRPEGTIEGYRGERFVQTPLGRIGSYPDGLFYLEGRVAAILAGTAEDHSLAAPDDLLLAEQAAHGFLKENGCELGDAEPARLGRIDLASELRFSDPSEGSAFLHSLASLDVPWCKSRVDGRKGSKIETVSFHGARGKTIYLRAYDKGIESGTDKPGVRIRVERQKRFRKSREPFGQDFAVSDLRKAYWGREFSRLADLPTATVCDVRGALETLAERAPTYALMERLAGYIVVGGLIEYSQPTRWRRESELRNLGIFVDPGTQVERLEVPVGAYLQTLGAAWAA